MSKSEEPFKRVTVQEAKQLVDEGKVRVIDVREPDEWVAGHIPQATLVPLPQILSDPQGKLTGDKGEPTLFVCGVGQRSAVACEVAATMGFSELYNLEGGTIAWIKSAYPVATGQ